MRGRPLGCGFEHLFFLGRPAITAAFV